MSFADYLRQRGVYITDAERDPNSRLGKANPKSWHNQGKAWDTRPVNGMSYDDFVQSVKNDGWNVLEARDEVKNPSSHATGPHWHLAVDGRKEMNGLADIMKPIYPLAQQEGMQAPLQTPGQQAQGLAALMPQMQVPQGNTDALKPKAFEKGGRGWEILGIIGDALQTAGGGQGTYVPYVMQQRELETEGRRRLAEQMAQRDAQMSDWLFKQRWSQENPGQAPMERDLAAWNRMTPEQRAAYAEMQDVRNPIAVSGPQGTYRVPRTFGQQGGPQPGVIEDGYVFVGGDPADPSSWRQQ